MKVNKNFGFTLIEIIVAVAIIGILASIAVASFGDSRNEAKYITARSDIKKIADLMIIARGNTSDTIYQITGSYCTECNCRNQGNIQSLATDHICRTSYRTVIEKLNTAANRLLSLDSSLVDPWGAPYLINENEGETTARPGTCYQDSISSAGPDGRLMNSDDIRYAIPVLKCSPDQGPHEAVQNWN